MVVKLNREDSLFCLTRILTINLILVFSTIYYFLFVSPMSSIKFLQYHDKIMTFPSYLSTNMEMKLRTVDKFKKMKQLDIELSALPSLLQREAAVGENVIT